MPLIRAVGLAERRQINAQSRLAFLFASRLNIFHYVPDEPACIYDRGSRSIVIYAGLHIAINKYAKKGLNYLSDGRNIYANKY